MADQTAEEKLEKVHHLQLEIQERRIQELEESNLRSLEREKMDHHEQRKAMSDVFNERRQELLKQNDGMLGAVGRLHGENETLKKSVQELQAEVKDRKDNAASLDRELQMMKNQLDIQIEARLEKSRSEIERLKAENIELRKRLGEKIPKEKDVFAAFIKPGKKSKPVKGKKA
jgi:hypothetical protein